MDVLAVEGRNKGLVQLGDDGVSDVIGAMLDFLELLDAGVRLTRMLKDIL